MTNYNFNYKRIEKINSINGHKALKEFLKENANILDRYEWLLVSRNKSFSLDIVDESYYEMLDWEFISMNIPMSISTLEKLSGYLNWYCVSAFQKLTIPFIKKYKDYLSLNVLLRNEQLDKETYAYAQKVYEENNDMEHYMKWRDNLLNSPSFRPSMPHRMQVKASELPTVEQISEMQKDEIKVLLNKYNVRYLYKNTIAELRKMLLDKCKEINDKEKSKSPDLMAEYKQFLFERIMNENKPVKSSPIESAEKVKKPQNKKLDYETLTKDQLKKILDKRKVRYLYKDTIAILRKKCIDSERRQ